MRLSTAIPTSLALAAALLLAACGSDSEPLATGPETTTPGGNQGIVAGTLEVSAARPVLTLRNTTEFVVGYMVVEKNMATVALFPPCGDNCPTIRQGESVAVNYSSIAGYTASAREAIVMWWTYAPRADGRLVPQGAVRTVNVQLN
jgi:hypothetical protein